MTARASFVGCHGDGRRWAWVVCAWTGAQGLACGVGAPSEPAAVETTCAAVAAGGPWWNLAFAGQGRRFHVEFDATPSASPIDAVIGLGAGSAAGFTQLGAIVRFSPAGTIDARDGASYRADATQPYQAGVAVHLRLDVDVATHRYSVWIRSAFGGYGAIARDYAFRAEQAGVARLDDVASKVDSATGALAICGLEVVSDATTADGCVIADAGGGFVSIALPDATVLDTLTFTATPSVGNLDGVIGRSAGPATRFSDLATAVRLAPSGVIDARDGGGYRADVARPYGVGALDFRVIADLTSHTYSVFQGTFQDTVEVARQYAFRTEQASVAHLDHLAAIVDGAQGRLAICLPRSTPSTGIAYSREGTYTVLPLANGEALIGDAATIRRVDAAGHVTAQLARGGKPGVDALGQVFVASISGDTLTVDKYDPGFAPLWTATRTVLAGTAIGAIAADPTGAVLIGMVTPQDTTVTVSRFTAGGAFETERSVTGNRVLLDGDQPIVAWSDGGTLRITRFQSTGAIAWARAFTGRADLTAMAVDPSHDLVFGGALVTAIDFGGGTLPILRTDNGPLNGFVVKLSADGAHVFSRKTGYTLVGGIATNGPRIAVSSTEQTQFHYVRAQLFDAAGVPGAPGFATGFGEEGFGGGVAMAASGRVWWNVDTQWPHFPRWPYLVVSN